jgi:uncharacterized protein (TIGR03084 family)
VSAPAPSLADLGRDLQVETAWLRAELADALGLDAAAWDTPTPAPGWAVGDQVSHLAYFDEATTLAVTDPDRFRAERAEVLADIDGFTSKVAARNRGRPGADVLAWFDCARAEMIERVTAVDAATRAPWYGPDMSVTSLLTARIMETWAHGQDVADALGVEHPPTVALRHVAHIGVRALPNSFRARQRAVPDDEVRVELTAPDGGRWTWGPADAHDIVRGSAVGFCLVVTQRRHPADTDVAATGPVAVEWMAIAQAFAGPPGAGRRPGQFPSTKGG